LLRACHAQRIRHDYIALDTGADPKAFAVEITPETGSEDPDEQAREVRLQVPAAECAQRAAAARSRSMARRLKRIDGPDSMTERQVLVTC
jgi:hypothetical protein